MSEGDVLIEVKHDAGTVQPQPATPLPEQNNHRTSILKESTSRKSVFNAKTGRVDNTIGALLVNDTLDYFHVKDETHSLQEDMKPWRNGNHELYLFGCSTEREEEIPICCKCLSCASPEDNKASNVQSVYHRKGSDRLIIKTKSQESTLSKAKRNPVLVINIVLIIGGFILLLSTLPQEGEDPFVLTYLGGGLMLYGLIQFMRNCCCRSQSGMLNYDLVTQSIPIDSIFYVERTVAQSKNKNGCCNELKQGEAYTFITIGFHRSNLSTKLQLQASTVDTITLNLESNQAMNLHQYLNYIMDSTHPQGNGQVRFAKQLLPQ